MRNHSIRITRTGGPAMYHDPTCLSISRNRRNTPLLNQLVNKHPHFMTTILMPPIPLFLSPIKECINFLWGVGRTTRIIPPIESNEAYSLFDSDVLNSFEHRCRALAKKKVQSSIPE